MSETEQLSTLTGQAMIALATDMEENCAAELDFVRRCVATGKPPVQRGGRFVWPGVDDMAEAGSNIVRLDEYATKRR